MSQPQIVADSLEDYLTRHPEYASATNDGERVLFLTTGEPERINARARIFWPDINQFKSASDFL